MKHIALSLSAAAFFLVAEADAVGPVWNWSDTAQISSDFTTEMSSCGAFQKVHVKAKNHSGAIDIDLGLVRSHTTQCYEITLDMSGKKRGDTDYKPISREKMVVCSGETREMDTSPFRKGDYEELRIEGKVANDKLLFPKLDTLELEVSGVVYPLGGAILFAHGLGATREVFDRFAAAAEEAGVKVYRYNVDPCAAIDSRAEELAMQFEQDPDFENIPDRSLKVVGHSMGGLDLRYIVSKVNKGDCRFQDVARKIRKVYTIATPHGGSFFAGRIPEPIGVACNGLPGLADLTDRAMAVFNRKYPYSDFAVEGAPIPFLAFDFECGSCGGTSDCVVGSDGQTWQGAPRHTRTLSGKHSKDHFTGIVGSGCMAELENIDEVLCPILNDR